MTKIGAPIQMKILICGDRNWCNEELVREQLAKLPPETIIIEGEAKGADTLARRIAEELGLEVRKYPAKWQTYGKAAGPIRNREMLKENPELVMAFHDDIQNSKGTKDMVTIAQKAGITVVIISNPIV
jgi:hypothetical protein